jgi:lipopolysaccharide heptosyltransferase I
MKVLILKPSSLGDVIQALPVLRLIKRHRRDAEVWWWIDEGLAPLLEGDPDLAGLFLFRRKRWGNPRHWPEMLHTVLELRRHNFDWVIDLQSLARTGAIAWLANGKLLAGLDEVREGARGFYDLVVRRPSYHTHAVDWYLSILSPLGVPVTNDFEWLPKRRAVANALHQKWPDDGQRWIALQPGARWLNKRWPVEHFAALVRLLVEKDDQLRFAILGGADDREFGGRITYTTPERCLDLTGKLSLPEMVEWLRRCEAMVTNDTGPMHVAAALRKPVIGLFGPTTPTRTGPYRQAEFALTHPLPCAPCMKPECHWSQPIECLRAISPERVCIEVVSRLQLRTGVAPASI